MKRLPVIDYPPGHFLALVLEHQFPPEFRPQPVIKRGTNFDPQEAAVRSRATALSRGITGTIKGLSRNSDRTVIGDATRAAITKAAAT